MTAGPTPARLPRVFSIAAGLMFVGVLVRVAVTYPAHKYLPDADSLLTGLKAFTILDGDAVVFYSGVRLGALESYFHAAVFGIAGASRETIAIAPLLAGAGTLLFFYLAMRELFGRRPAVAALLFMAIPSPAYLYWTYMPNGYPETLLLCAATIWLAARAARTGQPRDAFFLGLVMGLGVWNSLQSLSCSIPASLWLLWRLRRNQRPMPWVAIVVGSVMGAAPWILYNLRHPLASFRGSLSARPAAGVSQVGANIIDFFGYKLRELLLGLNPGSEIGSARNGLQELLQPSVLLIYCAAAAFLIIEAWTRQRPQKDEPDVSGRVLLASIAVTVFALIVFSYFGQFRGLTVRYVLPLYFTAAAFLGILVDRLWRKTRTGAAILAGLVLAFNASGYYWPGSAERTLWSQRKREDERLVRFLRARSIEWIIGDYWTVYPVNFLTKREISGIPYQGILDYYDYRRDLPRREARWALVSRDPVELDGWVRGVSLPGQRVRLRPTLELFLPTIDPAGRQTGPAVAEFVQMSIDPERVVPLVR